MMTRLLIPCACIAATTACSYPGPPCSGAAIADACEMARDLIPFLGLEYADATASGNATLGQGSTLGGFGKAAFAVHANVSQRTRPNLGRAPFRTDGIVSGKNFPAENRSSWMESADLTLGVTPGFHLGHIRAAGLDFLGRLTFMNGFENGDGRLRVSNDFALSLGARLGIVEEDALLPGLSLTLMSHASPAITFQSPGPDEPAASQFSISVSNLKVTTTSWRLMASKKIRVIALQAGVGQDFTSSSATYSVRSSGMNRDAGASTAIFETSRTNVFLSSSLDLNVATVVAEVGQLNGGRTSGVVNTFGGPANQARHYLTVGLRFGR